MSTEHDSRYEYDSKGKVFTQVVTKDILRARVQTSLHQIVGDIYLRHESRIKDELEFAEQFIAITDARVYDRSGALIYEAPFITLNRNQILWLALEDEEPSESG